MSNISVGFQPDHVTMLIGSNTSVNLTAAKPLVEDAWLNITVEGSNGVDLENQNILAPMNSILWPANSSVLPVHLAASGGSGGHVFLGAHSNSSQFGNLIEDAYASLDVEHMAWLDIASNIIGWIYFTVWTISFWPQVFLNFSRRSVIGLNFDFLAYNFIGFACYSTYNCVLYFSPEVQKEYFIDHPRGGLPVTIQDICFSLHAVAVIILTIFQTLIFERGGQRLSWSCRIISGAAVIFMAVSLILGGFRVYDWFMTIMMLSYVKLGSTLIKYIPQAWMNFRRQSTSGWSIWNVLLDFTGGVSSLIQMFILAYNYDDWPSIMGNPTKFALGAFSVLFDILFIIQHYWLYADSESGIADDSALISDETLKRAFKPSLKKCCCCCPIGHSDPPLLSHDDTNDSLGASDHHVYAQHVDISDEIPATTNNYNSINGV